ncbi:MAG TPA: NnrS family protein [Vulgatibacter sp.]|nr:NnrS family protein [Vulgatibacter sp.]
MPDPTVLPPSTVAPAPAGFFDRAIWLAGFRPFFALAFVAGAALPLIWVFAFTGVTPWPSSVPVLAWHAHEMYYGFGWAVLGGFLLTASKNWVKIRGIHGWPLALAVALWCVERAAIFVADPLVSRVLLNAFPAYVIAYLVWTLVRFNAKSFYKDNAFFVVALPIFLVAKNLLLTPSTWVLGTTMTLGLFRVAFVMMFERTMPQFMRNGPGIDLPLRRWIDVPIKVLVLTSVFEALLPAPWAAAVLGLAAALLLARLLTWHPVAGMKRFGIAVMYVGYLGLILHLALQAMRYLGWFMGVGTLATHAFTFLCMGIVIPAMLLRICQGHTGRKIRFTASDKLALGAMAAAAFFRLVATQLWPASYSTWILAAGIGWALCFLVVGARVGPFVFAPRIDGRVH